MVDDPDDEGEEGDFIRREKRKAGLRILVVGLLVLIPCTLWLAVFSDWSAVPGGTPITRERVVGFCAVAIGLGLTIAGAIQLARVKPKKPLPKARVVDGE